MISCPNCGLENNDFDGVCSACGAALNTPLAGNNKKKGKRGNKHGSHTSGGKKLWGIAAAVAVLIGLGIGGALIARGLSADGALMQAAGKSALSFAGSVTNEENIVSGSDAIVSYLDKGEYTLRLLCESDELLIDTNVDYSRKKRIMSGSADISIDGFAFGTEYSVDDDLLLVSSPTGMENTYGIDLGNLEKDLRKSPLGAFLPEELLEILKIDFFQKVDFKNFLQTDKNGELKALLRSAKVKYLDECVVSGVSKSIPCKMYQVTWDEGKANALISSLKKKGGIANVGAFLAEAVLKLEPDARCYVNDDKVLVGFDVVSVGVRYEFLLEGEKNPWDKFFLRITTLSGVQEVYTGGITNRGDDTVCYLGDEQLPYLTLHLTRNGDFVLETAGKGTILYGNLSSAGNAATLDITVDAEELGETRIVFSVSGLKTKPEPLSKHYIDLLDMGISDIQRALFDLGLMAS